MHVPYDDIIKKLKETRPVPKHPEKLTSQVMDHLSQRKPKMVNVYPGHWRMFTRFRKAMAVAAVFLVGFFIFQQWEMMYKVTRLEEKMWKNKSASFEDVANTNTGRFEEIFRQQLQKENMHIKMPVNPEQVLTDRNLMNSLLQAYRQLQEENRQLKEELLKEYSDTSHIKENNQYKL